jgi:NAD(P)-dependent dehydrogenase (short-subunit alcohol dehydrogenase family)
MDVRRPDEVEQAIRTIRGEFGGLHVLGNIAGTFIRAKTAALTPDQWDETLDTNLKGPFLCTHFALPVMIEQGYGRIISIASGYGVAPRTLAGNPPAVVPANPPPDRTCWG